MAYQPVTQSLVSSANSTSTVLAGAAAFTGTSEDISNYASVTVSGIASHASATDGLSIQQSSNGTNWDITDNYTVAANTGFNFGVQVSAKFFRIVYTNGATLQTSFRLQTIFHASGNPDSSQRPQDGRPNDIDTQENSSFLMGFNGTSWDRIRTKGTGVLSNDITTINNVTPLMGTGASGTGAMRTVLTNDYLSTSLVRGAATATSTGLTILKVQAAATTNGALVLTGTRAIYGWHLVNNATATRYVRFYNKATAPTVGTDSPAFVIPLPASGGAVMAPGNLNIALSLGFGISITAAAADLDATATAANDVVGTILYA